MTGTPSHTSIRRLRGVGRTLFALGTALILVAALAPFALADHAQASDSRAILRQGNPTAGNTCTQGQLVIGDEETLSTSADGISGVKGKGDVSTGKPEPWTGVEVLNITVTNPLIDVSGAWVKGGPGANEYRSHLSNLIAPRTHEGTLAGISHWFVCYTVRQPVGDPAIVKSGPADPVELGANYTFTLTITNDGDSGSSTGAFTVSDTVPAEAGTVTGVSDDSADASCSNAGNVVTCSVDDLAEGDTITVTINVTAPSGNEDCDTVENTASLSGFQGDNSSTENDSSSDTVTIDGCEEPQVVPDPTPSVDVEKLVSLNGGDFADADSAPGVELDLDLDDPDAQVEFQVVVTNTSGDGTVLTLNSLTDDVTAGGADELDLTGCTFPEGGLPDGESVTCDLGPFDAEEGVQHTNTVTVSASGGRQTVGDSDPANYAIDRVGGEVIERPEPPAPEPPVAEPEPAPEVLAEELPRTGPADLWLAGLALMLLGAGLLILARGKAMDARAYASGTWWNHRP